MGRAFVPRLIRPTFLPTKHTLFLRPYGRKNRLLWGGPPAVSAMCGSPQLESCRPCAPLRAPWSAAPGQSMAHCSGYCLGVALPPQGNNATQSALFLARVAGTPSRTPLRGFVADGSGPGAQAALRPLFGAFAPRGHYCAACTLAALWAANGQKSEKPAPVIPEGFSPAPLPSPPPPLGAPGKRKASLAGCGPPRHI